MINESPVKNKKKRNTDSVTPTRCTIHIVFGAKDEVSALSGQSWKIIKFSSDNLCIFIASVIAWVYCLHSLRSCEVTDPFRSVKFGNMGSIK